MALYLLSILAHAYDIIIDSGLVPDDTVHKGTTKHNKTDKKSPILGARSSINIRLKIK